MRRAQVVAGRVASGQIVDRIGARLEVRRVAEEIPAIGGLSSLAQVIAGTHGSPRLCPIQTNDRSHLPAFEQLGKGFLSRDHVRWGKGEAVPDVIVAAGVLALR